MIEPPKKPVEPEYEDLSAIPDLQCEWDEDGWDGDYHNGYVCAVCGEHTECYMCAKGNVKVNLDCLRNQAEGRNFARRRAYEKTWERYEAQMAYYRELTE